MQQKVSRMGVQITPLHRTYCLWRPTTASGVECWSHHQAPSLSVGQRSRTKTVKVNNYLALVTPTFD